MKEQACAMCGKNFAWDYGNIYKLEFAGKMNRFCGYTCFSRAKAEKEKHSSAGYQKILKKEAQ